MKKKYITFTIFVFILSFILINGILFDDRIHQPGEVTSRTTFFALIVTIGSMIIIKIESNNDTSKRKKSVSESNELKYIIENDNLTRDIMETDPLRVNLIKVIVMSWCNNKVFSSSTVEYPKYFIDTYRIEKPEIIHNQIIDEKYLRESTNEEKLQSLKVSDLKKILKENGLIQSGPKVELINRVISSNIDLSFLNDTLVYTATEKGLEFLEVYGFYDKLRKHKYSRAIDPAQYIRVRNKKKYKASFRDIIWACFQENYNYGFLKEEWNYIAVTSHCSYELLLEENHVDAITFLLESIIIFMSGMRFGNYVEDLHDYIIPESYIKELISYELNLEDYEMTEEEHLQNRIDEAIIRTSTLPFNYFGKNEITDIIFKLRETGKVSYSLYKTYEPDRNKYIVMEAPQYN